MRLNFEWIVEDFMFFHLHYWPGEVGSLEKDRDRPTGLSNSCCCIARLISPQWNILTERPNILPMSSCSHYAGAAPADGHYAVLYLGRCRPQRV